MIVARGSTPLPRTVPSARHTVVALTDEHGGKGRGRLGLHARDRSPSNGVCAVRMWLVAPSIATVSPPSQRFPYSTVGGGGDGTVCVCVCVVCVCVCEGEGR